MRKLAFLALLAAAMLINACSSGGGSDTPSDTQPHPQNWFSTHPNDLSTNGNYSDCVLCHGTDLEGSGDAPSCYHCHSYNDAPPFTIHSPVWDDPYTDHRPYTRLHGPKSCKPCHGSTLTGYQSAPSCYSASFNGAACHADGPQGPPHPVDDGTLPPDESYLLGSNHGPDAKADLTSCQLCHGQPGDPGSNPRFNVGIFKAGGNGCESCHGVDYAHPSEWAGPNDTYHYSAGNIQNACTLCHGVALDGVGGVGVSCLGCHVSATTFTLDCAYCHGYPPDGSADVATETGVDHSHVPIESHLECAICHGMSQSSVGGTFLPANNYLLFDYDTDTNGDHWDGNVDMNAGTGYNPDNYGCDTAVCHGNAGHRLSDSGLPVELKDFFGDD